MFTMKSHLAILTILLVSQANCETFSATSNLLNLSQSEENVIKETRELIEELRLITLKLEGELRVMVKEHEKMMRNPVEYVSNPLNALLLIKRLSIDLKEREEYLPDIGKKFTRNLKSFVLPRADFEGAVDGLLRLQLFYGLTSEDLAQGIIEDEKYREDLSAGELLSIGDEMARTSNFIMSLSYLDLALNKNRQTREMSDIKILESMFSIYNNSGDIDAAIKVVGKIVEIDPASDYVLKKIALELENLFYDDDDDFASLGDDEDEDPFKKDGKYTPVKELKLFADACSGRLKQSDEELSKLYCRYLWKPNHITRIAPFKIEVMNFNPYIAIYHDIISDEESDLFIEMSNPEMKRAATLNSNATDQISNVRVSKHSWHPDSSHKVFDTLTKRVADMTGLNMDTSEHWQTQNYGIGGHYNAHYDFTTKDSQPFSGGNGNRIATVLVYLSHVEKGGATTFPFLSMRVAPKRGSAVFWYNLSSSGDREFYTRHSGCPVLLGSKWVANKWIHEYGQEFTRPCEKFPIETDELYYQKFY